MPVTFPEIVERVRVLARETERSIGSHTKEDEELKN